MNSVLGRMQTFKSIKKQTQNYTWKLLSKEDIIEIALNLTE